MRSKRAKKRGPVEKPTISIETETDLKVTKKDGTTVPLDIKRLAKIITDSCEGLDDVDPKEVLEQSLGNLYDGVSVSDMRTSLIMTARTKVEKEPNYSFVTARILMDQIRNEALEFLGIAEEATYADMKLLENWINFKQKTSIDKGLKEFINWYLAYYKIDI